MKREPNREYIEPDEDKIFDEMVELVRRQMESGSSPLRRAQHPKATGCVNAEFQIAESIRPDLRHGVFSKPGRTFRAIVRFSNARRDNDRMGDGRGLAIKLLDVHGTRAVPGDGDTTQDFLMVNHPRFPFRTPKTYLRTMRRMDWVSRNIPAKLRGIAELVVFLLDLRALPVVFAIGGKKVASPLKSEYWSGTPYWLGPAGKPTEGQEVHAVKYSVAPIPLDRTARPVLPKNPSNDYLTEVLNRELETEGAEFKFKVQLQTHADKMPVEDTSVEWDENESRPITVATLRILRIPKGQKLDQSAFEKMSLNPWHALAEHRPIGGMNRLRKRVYEESVAKRLASVTRQASAA